MTTKSKAYLVGGGVGSLAAAAFLELLGIDRKVPAVTPHAQSHQAQFDALLKAFK